MRHTMVLGSKVGTATHNFGSLSKIVVENGVANQVVVEPGLFGGPARVVPISDFEEATAEGITLKVGNDEWKSYNAYKLMHNPIEQPSSADGLPVSRGVDAAAGLVEPTQLAVPETTITVPETSVILSTATQVGTIGPLHGIITETGLPQALLVGDQTIPWDQVSVLDTNQIELGGKAAAPHSADQATHVSDEHPTYDVP